LLLELQRRFVELLTYTVSISGFAGYFRLSIINQWPGNAFFDFSVVEKKTQGYL